MGCSDGKHLFVNLEPRCQCGQQTRSYLGDYDSFVDKMWFYDPSKHGGMPELGYTFLALCGEVGEVAEKVKKYYRDGGDPAHSDEGFNLRMLKELGDALFYLVKGAHLVGATLDDVARTNVGKLTDRQSRGKMHGEGDDR